MSDKNTETTETHSTPKALYGAATVLTGFTVLLSSIGSMHRLITNTPTRSSIKKFNAACTGLFGAELLSAFIFDSLAKKSGSKEDDANPAKSDPNVEANDTKKQNTGLVLELYTALTAFTGLLLSIASLDWLALKKTPPQPGEPPREITAKPVAALAGIFGAEIVGGFVAQKIIGIGKKSESFTQQIQQEKAAKAAASQQPDTSRSP